MVCEIIFLFFYEPDYYLKHLVIDDELSSLKLQLKGEGVKLFQYSGKPRVAQKLILECFNAIECDLPADRYLVIYSKDEDFEQFCKHRLNIRGYKVREAIEANYIS